MYWLLDTTLAGYHRKLNISFWTGAVLILWGIAAIVLERKELAPGVLILVVVGIYCYYLVTLSQAAFRLDKNGGVWVLGSLLFGPIGLVIGYVRICSAIRYHIAIGNK
jgi:hypothetical protein